MPDTYMHFLGRSRQRSGTRASVRRCKKRREAQERQTIGRAVYRTPARIVQLCLAHAIWLIIEMCSFWESWVMSLSFSFSRVLNSKSAFLCNEITFPPYHCTTKQNSGLRESCVITPVSKQGHDPGIVDSLYPI